MISFSFSNLNLSALILIFLVKECHSIVNGENKNAVHHPYVAIVSTKCLLYTRRNCTGVIVNQQHVLTAANCLVDLESNETAKPEDVLINVGISTIDEMSETGSNAYHPSEIHGHPNFNVKTLDSDLVLLKIKTKIAYSFYVAEICLSYYIRDDVQQRYFTVGYGSVTSQVEQGGKLILKSFQGYSLKRGELLIRNDSVECDHLFICTTPIKKDPTTAYRTWLDNSPCIGDEGSPLIPTVPVYSVDGIFSHMEGEPLRNGAIKYCSGQLSPLFPAMKSMNFSPIGGKAKYTRLAAHYEFIDHVIGRFNYCSDRGKGLSIKNGKFLRI